jgi:hypothetical protein
VVVAVHRLIENVALSKQEIFFRKELKTQEEFLVVSYLLYSQYRTSTMGFE